MKKNKLKFDIYKHLIELIGLFKLKIAKLCIFLSKILGIINFR